MFRRILLLTVLLVPSGALALSTAFTYQGRLEEAGAPANGPHDFRFGLFDAADNGAPAWLPVAMVIGVGAPLEARGESRTTKPPVHGDGRCWVWSC